MPLPKPEPLGGTGNLSLDAGRECDVAVSTPTPSTCPTALQLPQTEASSLAEPKAASGAPPAGQSSALCSLAECVHSLAYLLGPQVREAVTSLPILFLSAGCSYNVRWIQMAVP